METMSLKKYYFDNLKRLIILIRDARTILERNIKLQEEGEIDNDPNVYRGQTAYRSFVKKDASQIGMNKYTGYADDT
jgi:hypothetical protein